MTSLLVAINIAVAVVGVGLHFLPGDVGWRAVPSGVNWAPGVTAQEKADAVTVVGSKRERVTRGEPILTEPPPRGRVIGQQLYSRMSVDQAWGHFSTQKAFRELEVWRFVTFQFLHIGFLHLALNLVGLWTFGPDVEEYLGKRRFLAFYLACGIFGAVAYLLLNGLGNLFPDIRVPGLLFGDPRTPLVGASAGIFGIMLAAAFVVPQRVIDLLYFIPIRIKPAVYLFAGVALINLFLGSRNAGGEAAHIGGAVAGYYFIRHMYHLRDFFDVFGPAERLEPSQERAGPVNPSENDAEVDRILVKIKEHGRESLTEQEVSVLKAATDRRRRNGAGGSG